MNKEMYNNVIEHTLKRKPSGDPLSTARAIFNNLGVALPKGDLGSVYNTIKTGKYMGWKRCSLKDAQDAANNGIAAIGINDNKIVVFSADNSGAAASSPVIMPSNCISPYSADGLECYSYTYGATIPTEDCSGEKDYLIYHLSGIQTFSNARDGEKWLSEHFKVKEFRCHDGTDEIKLDMQLVVYLQRLRYMTDAPIIINSGYRTPSHNASVGGAKNSMHLYGKAADIVCTGKTPLQLAQLAEAIGMTGIEWNVTEGYTHVDTRATIWHVKCVNNVFTDVSTFKGL